MLMKNSVSHIEYDITISCLALNTA